ncbi:bifunctional nicotinamidase/pyrazinamidase [Paraburkholderia megapolitana]|uniref:Nicotinamidase n=1 Tax=Paraburkholderia megapolitana TaxID=420953 RepID=A0A1I3MQC4_9BURK|nr:bifunctional nicotinamidase/pyrazinamidase [Paraburkholderia megapolitana]QDQ84096.1 bifunctional nicotinamidase/pyrazinamidase [Paraburkholderia megapolitana]SFI99183.1 nicotinamidase/pyrazinamidase [Paraburkholderia megapolitana]
MNRRFFLKTASLCGMTAAAGLAARVAFGQSAPASIEPGADSVLLVVDTQNCFTSGGTLAVKDGEQIVPVINRIGKAFANVVLTQDWHPRGHVSFASSHPGKKPFDTVHLSYGTQVLWPDHCIQGTEDAGLRQDLDVPQAQLIIRKGYHKNVDSYSAFMEADRHTSTGLGVYLKAHGIRRVFVTGLATDFCVANSALDARAEGFDVYVIEDATRAVDLNGSLAEAWDAMRRAGVKRIQSSDLRLVSGPVKS